MKKITINQLPFIIGKFSNITDHLLRQSNKKNNLIVLPCSLNDLAQKEKTQAIAAAYSKIDYCTTDGMPLVWWSKLKYKKTQRVYGPDLMINMLRCTQGKKYRHMFFGSNKKTLKKLEDKIKKIAPDINIVLTISPPFRKFKNKEHDKYINLAKKNNINMIWLGLSSPKQIVTAAKWKNKISANIFCVGAAFDFISKNKKQAPKLMQKVGLEWLYRFLSEPKRLGRRYFLNIPLFLIKKIVIHFRNFFKFLIIFLVFFFLYKNTFLKYELNYYPDSKSYTYLIDQSDPINTFLRPIVYPFYLYIVKKINLLFNFNKPIICSHLILLSFAQTINLLNIFFITKKNYLLTALGLILLFFNFQITQFSIVLSPEIVLFFLTSIYIFALIQIKNFDSKLITVLVVLLLMTFTKPVTIYLPFLILPLFITKLPALNTSVKNINLVKTSMMLLIYAASIIAMQSIHLKKYGYSTFSIIKEINILGKVLKYDLRLKNNVPNSLNKAKQNVEFFKKNNPKAYSPWTLVIPTFGLEAQNANSWAKLYDYGKLTAKENWFSYLKLSLLELPEIVDEIQTSAYGHEYVGDKNMQIIESDYHKTFKSIYSKIELVLKHFYIKIGLIILLLLALIKKINSNNRSKSYTHLLLSCAYIFMILALSAYEQYPRLKAPFSGLFIITILTAISELMCRNQQSGSVPNS